MEIIFKKDTVKIIIVLSINLIIILLLSYSLNLYIDEAYSLETTKDNVIEAFYNSKNIELDIDLPEDLLLFLNLGWWGWYFKTFS